MKKDTINIAGININYLFSKLTQEFTTLLIHGNSLNAMSFKPQLELEKFTNYNVAAIDLPGHGESEHVAEFEAGYCKMVESWIHKLGLKKWC